MVRRFVIVKISLVMSCAISLAYGSAANAWSDLGHQIVGELAEQNLTPRAKNFVRGILGIEPLAVAATWPDHVRDDKRFGGKDDAHDFGPFHYCEVPTGFDYTSKPKTEPKDCMGVLAKAQILLKDSSVDRETKMIALRYLIHVVGDIHQPLHVGNGFDRGGNACDVRVRKGSSGGIIKENFHRYWDNTIVEELGSQIVKTPVRVGSPIYYSRFVEAIKEHHPELGPTAVKAQNTSTPLDWLKDSQTVRESIYPDDAKTLKKGAPGEEYKRRTYCQWYKDQKADKKSGHPIESEKLPLLGSEYAKKYGVIAEGQLIKAGLRLASMLNQIAKDAPEKNAVNDTQQENVLQTVVEAFTNK